MRANSNHWLAKALGVVMLLTVLTLAGCGGGGSGTGAGSKPGSGINLTIGSKNDPDGQLLAEMYSLLLQNQGFNLTTKLALGQTTVLDAAIKSGAVDIYPEFNGTALSIYKLPQTNDPQTAYTEAKNYYEQNLHVTWLDPALKLNDSYGYCTSQAKAQQYNLSSIADLVPVANKLVFATQQDAKDIYNSAGAAYGIHFKSTLTITEQLSFQAVTGGQADINECYTTDPAIVNDHFVLLKDTKNAFPPYNPSPIVRDQTLAKSSAIASTLNPLAQILTTDSQTALIAEVGTDPSKVPSVAKKFLQDQNLLPKS
jgi:glycine betaine/choline ABC-type transport system substrate-binding protein